jgi:hypothetical protein
VEVYGDHIGGIEQASIFGYRPVSFTGGGVIMTMTVVPNPDGSYTVKCGDAEVIVGGRGGPTAPVPPPYTWPEPDDNDGGVVAYLHVGPRRPPRFSRFATQAPMVQPEYFEPPALLAKAIPGAAMSSRGARRGRLVLELQVPAGQPFDVDRLKEAAWAVRGQSQQVRLHVYVEMSAPAPLDFSRQVELP